MDIQYSKFEMQGYLQGTALETREKKFLFQLRTRMMDLKMNFKNSYTDLSCPLCARDDDSQEHVLECPQLLKNQNSPRINNMLYLHIFEQH